MDAKEIDDFIGQYRRARERQDRNGTIMAIGAIMSVTGHEVGKQLMTTINPMWKEELGYVQA